MSLARTGLLVLVIMGAGVAALGARAFELAQGTLGNRRAAAAARASAESLATHVTATRERALVARLRAQVAATPGLLLAIELDSGIVTLVRDGLPLRRMRVERFAGRESGGATVVRGEYAVERVTGIRDSVDVPAVAWTARGEIAPAQRRLRGALGPVLVQLVNGPWLYTRPAEGPLADSAFVLPGALRFDRRDLPAIKPNLTVGTPVFIF